MNICVPVHLDHNVTTNPLGARWIGHLVVLTLNFTRRFRSASISLGSKIHYHSNVLAIWYTKSKPDVPICLSRFQRISADEHQTFCAIFDLWIKVIDAEFYGMDWVQCMEYVLRLCVALPVRIWMTHYIPPPSHSAPAPIRRPQSSPGTSPSAPFRAISSNYDCPRPEFTHTHTHAKLHVSKRIHKHTQCHTVRGLTVRCPRQHSPVWLGLVSHLISPTCRQ